MSASDSSNWTPDPAKLFRQRIGGIRRRVQRYRLGLAIGIAVTALAASAGATWLMDWTFRLEVSIRAGLLVASLVVIALVIRRGLRIVGAPATDDGIALALERANSSFRGRLVSAVQFTRARVAGASTSMLTTGLEDRVIHDAATMLRGWSPGRLLRIRPLLLTVMVAAIAVGTFSSVAAAFPENFGVWAQRNLLLQDVRWPRATQLAFVGFTDDTRVHATGDNAWITPVGEHIELIVEVGGELPETVMAEVTEIRPDGREVQGDPVMFTPTDRTRTRWVGGWPELSGKLRFRVLAGDNDIGPYQLEARALPAVDELEVWVTPPAYTAGETWSAPPGREIRCLRQSGLWIRATINEPFESVTVTSGDWTLPVELTGDGFIVRLIADHDRTLEVRLADRWGFGDASPGAEPAFRLSIVALPDAPPREVVVEPDGLSQEVTPFARLALKVRAFDDHGIAAGSMRVAADRREGNGLHRDRELPASGIMGTDAEWTVLEEAGPLAPTIGESIIVQVTVRDTNAFDGPGVARGQYSFTVVEPQKLLESLTKRLSEARGRFEEAVDEHRRNGARFDHWQTLPGDTPDQQRLQRVQMADIDSKQRGVTNTVDEVAEVYSGMLRELWLNRLIEDDEHRSQQRRVVRPLGRVLDDGLRPLRENLRRYRQSAHSGGETPDASSVTSRFAGTLREMEEILDAMKRLETFAELLEDAETTLRLHQEAHEHTRQAQESRTGDFLDGDDDDD